MKKYEKPVLEVVELRPEERLAYTCATANYKFTVDDEYWNDGNSILEEVIGRKKNSDGSWFKFAFWDISLAKFREFLGL